MYQMRSKVLGSRTDTHGNLKLTGALDYLQDCSLQWLESEQSFSDFLSEKNAGMFLVFRQVDVRRMPKYREDIIIQTSIFDCKQAFGLRNTNIYDANENPCILSWSIGAFVNLQTGKMIRLTPAEMKNVKYDEKTEMEYLPRKIELPENNHWESMEKVIVKRNDIDLYHHMNNTKYVEIAYDDVPIDSNLKRLRIEFKKPALLGDEIFPRVTRLKHKYYIELRNGASQPYAVVEFTL